VQIFRAIKEGYDVRGLYYWTLMDNFEWNCGYLMKFGVYHWSADDPKGKNRTLKPGGRLLAQIYKSIPTPMEELKKHCQVYTHTAGLSIFQSLVCYACCLHLFASSACVICLCHDLQVQYDATAKLAQFETCLLCR
jgi:hypothetical protein